MVTRFQARAANAAEAAKATAAATEATAAATKATSVGAAYGIACMAKNTDFELGAVMRDFENYARASAALSAAYTALAAAYTQVPHAQQHSNITAATDVVRQCAADAKKAYENIKNLKRQVFNDADKAWGVRVAADRELAAYAAYKRFFAHATAATNAANAVDADEMED